MPQIVSPIFALNEDGKIEVLNPDPSVTSPAIGVTVWSLSLDLSLAPTSLYFGDLVTFSGVLQESDGVNIYAIASKPIDIVISNPSVTSVIAHTDYTSVDGTYTLQWNVVETEARVGTNYFYAQSSW
jgi:hypothetical protein